MSNILEVKDLCVSYGGIKAVKHISFQVPKGEVVTLIGANGAGKSSTLRSIVGLVKPASGSVMLNGKEIAGKTPEQIAGILEAMEKRDCANILVTRIPQETADFLGSRFPLRYEPLSKLAVALPKAVEGRGSVVIATGGTSDMGVAEEAAITAEVLGNRVTRLYDVGVAGLHRLLSNLEPLMTARVVIAVAGMEGALASVVGGLVDCPVIAVPTSVGYGASFGGVSALLSMLNSCASGVSVVNIDNGFGAGFLASRINQMEGIQ